MAKKAKSKKVKAKPGKTKAAPKAKVKAKGKSKAKPAAKPVLRDISNRKVRVLIAKAGLDGHDRGAKVIARALRDAGFEVIYTGLHQTPEMIVHAALQEDVDVVGVSILSGAHNAVVPEIIRGMKKAGADDVMFLVGGIIPEEDILSLKRGGVHMVFTPGASIEGIVQYIRGNLSPRSL